MKESILNILMLPEPKPQTTKIIALSGLAILLFIFSMAFSNLYFLTSTNNSLEAIENTHDRKFDLVMQMTHIVRERSMIMLTMYLEDDLFRIEELNLEFSRLAAQFIQLRESFKKLGLSEAETREFNHALALIRETQPLQNDIVDRIRSGGDKSLRGHISRNDLPLEYKLLNVFNNLSSSIQKNAIDTRNRARRAHARSILISALVALVISVSVSVLLYRSLRKIRVIEQNLIDESASLGWDATHDPLTAIFNRRWLTHRIDQLNSEVGDSRVVHTILCIDLDGFKPINDQHGHAAGDQYLTQFCREVEHHIRQNDVFARVGGDEFVVLLEKCDLEKSSTIAEQILDRVRNFIFEFEGHKISVQCSIGLAKFKPGIDDVENLLRRADAVCYEAKRRGKNQIVVEG